MAHSGASRFNNFTKTGNAIERGSDNKQGVYISSHNPKTSQPTL
jgi:hypothetical protein